MSDSGRVESVVKFVPSDRHRWSWTLFASLLLLLGCDGAGSGGAGAPDEPASHAQAPASGAANDEILTRMAQADAADGTTDKVIRKCVTCSLYMDGDAAHAATAHGYEVHLCSESCLERFERDPDRAVLSMKPAQ